jgi:Tol biopolymer transport system component
MPDLEDRLRGADRVRVPDLWERIESEAARPPQPRRPGRLVTIALSLAVAAAGTVGVVAAFLGRGEPAGLPANGVFVYADGGPQPPEIPFDNIDLFAFDPATGERTNLTNTPTVAESSPVWSPDGSRLVYERTTAEGTGAELRLTYDLVVANADGTDPRAIQTCGDSRCGFLDVSWSPDDTHLAWTAEKRVGEGFVQALQVFDLETETTSELCDSRSCGYAGQLAWSPDGTSLAFSEAGTGRLLGPFAPAGPIWLADLTTGEVEPLTSASRRCGRTLEGCVFDSAPAWSPDGTEVAFVRTTSPGQTDATTVLTVVDSDGTDERALSGCGSNDQCTQGPLAWSPDGDSIAFFERYRPSALTLLAPATGEATQIPLPPDVGESAYSLRWSPDGTKVAFIGGQARASNLYVVDVSSGEVREVARGIARQGAITWLPAGAIDLSASFSPPTETSTVEPTAPVPAGTIFFASSNGSNQEDEGVEIWAVSPDRSNLTRLTENEFVEADPAASPDGMRIAFRSYRPGDRNTQVYVMNADGSDQRVLTDRLTGAGPAAWSPDGTHIAFVSSEGYGEPGGVFVMDADGSNQRLVAEGNASDPNWSPDGSRIVYSLNTPDGRTVLAIVDLATGGVTQPLPDLPGEQSEPVWSPDGATIAFEWSTASGAGLYLVAPDGSGLRRVADGSSPSWSPDGTWLAYTHFDDDTGPQIWIVAADGTGPHPVTSMAGFIEGTGIAAITGAPSWTVS